MTEKRFTMKGSTILECGEEITAWDCCYLLNELHEENQALKSFIKRLTSCDGKIYLMNGMAYNTKVLSFEPKK